LWEARGLGKRRLAALGGAHNASKRVVAEPVNTTKRGIWHHSVLRNASNEAAAESEEKRLERTLYSVLHFLQALAATLPADILEYCAEERMDPFKRGVGVRLVAVAP
jgi:hypothetical protein